MRRSFMVVAGVIAVSMSLGSTALADHPEKGSGAPPGGDHGGDDRGSRRGGSLSFPLAGSQVPGGGDPKGRGNATLRLDPDKEVVCLNANWQDLAGDVTGIHIHKGPQGETGPHHIEILNDESLAGAWNQVQFCVQVTGGHYRAQDHPQNPNQDDSADPANRIQEVPDDPAGFYLNVHSTAFPDGAIRGQLPD